MKANKKIELQRVIIAKQQKQIASMQEEIDRLKTDNYLYENVKNEGYNEAKELIVRLEKDRLILNDAIKKARIAEESYNQMIEKIRPLIKKYAKELKGLNDAIEVTRMNIEKQGLACAKSYFNGRVHDRK